MVYYTTSALVASMGWKAWQLEWYYSKMRKTLPFCFIHFLAYVLAAYSTPVSSLSVQPHTPRCIATGFFFCIAWLTFYLDVCKSVPPEKGDFKEQLLRLNVNGLFSYFTFHIIFLECIYWSMCFLAEVWLFINPQDAYLSHLMAFNYSIASIVSALGPALGMLFLKFNWYESDWRSQVLQVYESRGYVHLGSMLLFTHLNQFPVALLDMMVLKDHQFLQNSMPNIESTSLAISMYAMYYVAFTHVNYRYSGGYPYPFFSVVLKTWSSEILFVFGVFCFVMGLFAMMMTITDLGWHVTHLSW